MEIYDMQPQGWLTACRGYPETESFVGISPSHEVHGADRVNWTMYRPRETPFQRVFTKFDI